MQKFDVHTIDNTHFPAADDITMESLDYFFWPASDEPTAEIPWVEIKSGCKTDAEEICEHEQILIALKQQMHHKNRQLQRLCILIGYMQGQLHDREEQLKVLPDLRYKAALSVARGLEAERANEKIRELEDALRRLSLRSHSKLEEMLKALSCSIESDDAAITILNCLGLIGLSGILWTIIFGF